MDGPKGQVNSNTIVKKERQVTGTEDDKFLQFDV